MGSVKAKMSIFKGQPSSSQANLKYLDRALGSFLGLAIGDALGATVEFMTAREIAAQYKVHNRIIGGGWLNLEAGCVTDDTEMALALGFALIAEGGWNPHAIADAFVVWMRSQPVDIGNTCRRGINHYLSTKNLCAPPAGENAGNGAAMRNLPTVLVSLDNEALLIERSIEQAHITHNHPKSDAATAALACITRRLVLEGTQAACDSIAADLVARHPDFGYRPWPGNTSGYIVDTVQTVFDGFFNTGSFEECLVRVVNRGGDADTTGALAGQLAGALYGVQGIPVRWLHALDTAVVAAIHSQTPRLLSLSFP
ncbi:MAG TPA: ADP-ribosyl-[dinitrogen reductase] hydrolase, partial [Candidatus Acidoferrales bacterium]|nr:ADP-ribosyl-[dinitrogen reductase] hydrolase [Candidatus Acidoferrales bacterium]